MLTQKKQKCNPYNAYRALPANDQEEDRIIRGMFLHRGMRIRDSPTIS